MAEIQIDDDWKKQAQEEKRRLAEQAKAAGGASATAAPSSASTESHSRGQLPQAGIESIVSLLSTQALYYLGEMVSRSGEPVVDLDAARHYIDSLGILAEKTEGRLTSDEQKLLDATLYELRMRYVSIASQMIR